jgi:hypothetical protein
LAGWGRFCASAASRTLPPSHRPPGIGWPVLLPPRTIQASPYTPRQGCGSRARPAVLPPTQCSPHVSVEANPDPWTVFPGPGAGCPPLGKASSSWLWPLVISTGAGVRDPLHGPRSEVEKSHGTSASNGEISRLHSAPNALVRECAVPLEMTGSADRLWHKVRFGMVRHGPAQDRPQPGLRWAQGVLGGGSSRVGHAVSSPTKVGGGCRVINGTVRRALGSLDAIGCRIAV